VKGKALISSFGRNVTDVLFEGGEGNRDHGSGVGRGGGEGIKVEWPVHGFCMLFCAIVCLKVGEVLGKEMMGFDDDVLSGWGK
jgi:hypothetical protein